MRGYVVNDVKLLQVCTEIFNGNAHDGTIFKKTLRVSPKVLVLGDSGYRGIQKQHARPTTRKSQVSA